MTEHKLGQFMAEISEDAGLSHRYTNHSLRATTVTPLDDANQEGCHIISVTERASAIRLGPYSRTSEKRKKTSSVILTFVLDGNYTSDYEPPAKKPVPSTRTISCESPSQGNGRRSTSVIISPRQGAYPNRPMRGMSPRFPSNATISRKPPQTVMQPSLSQNITVVEERFDMDSGLDDILQSIDLDALPWSQTFCQTNNSKRSNCYSQPIFHTCNFTINYH